MSDRPLGADVEQLTHADLESFAAKFQDWGAALPPKEQAILALLLAHTQDNEEVEGYLYNLFSGGSFQNTAMTRLTPAFTAGIGLSHGYSINPWMESVPPAPPGH